MAGALEAVKTELHEHRSEDAESFGELRVGLAELGAETKTQTAILSRLDRDRVRREELEDARERVKTETTIKARSKAKLALLGAVIAVAAAVATELVHRWLA